jgi:hypothetical protein
MPFEPPSEGWRAYHCAGQSAHSRETLSKAPQMSLRLIHVPDHLIIPYGSARKYQRDRMRMVSVGARGLYFKTDLPVIYINRAEKRPLRLSEITDHMPDLANRDEFVTTTRDVINQFERCKNLLSTLQPNPTRHEILFLDLFFEYIKHEKFGYRALTSDRVIDNKISDWSDIQRKWAYELFNVLLPIPEMQIYVHDPLRSDLNFEPDNNFRVDFGFWNGTNLIAIEIDGLPPPDRIKDEYVRDKQRDRMLRRADIDLVHILNSELEVFGLDALKVLLPKEITNPNTKPPQSFPFDIDDIPF